MLIQLFPRKLNSGLGSNTSHKQGAIIKFLEVKWLNIILSISLIPYTVSEELILIAFP